LEDSRAQATTAGCVHRPQPSACSA
jgi:hypothetical protein